MTKRCGTYHVNNGKKLKLDDEEIWDDDIDDEALEKCFEVASQVYEQNTLQSNSVSQLASYSCFKGPSGFITSTQVNNPTSISSNRKLTLVELDNEVQKLKQQNEEKEGEISILRSKIKETSNIVQAEQHKTLTEWREKLHISQREVRAVKSKLEFKDLEIVNLKQQLSELRKINLDTTLNNTQVALAIPVKVNPVSVSSVQRNGCIKKLSCREVILEPVYPLKCVSLKNFEETKTEKHIIKTISYKLGRNTIPYLQNQQTCSEFNFQHKCVRINEKEVDLTCVYGDVLKLCNSTLEELNSNECIEHLNKIICVTIILLQDLNDYLIEVGSNLRTEDIQQADSNYLLDDREPYFIAPNVYSSDEFGIRAGKILDFLSRLVLYSNYVAEYLCSNGQLTVSENVGPYGKYISSQNIVHNDFYVLSLLTNIVTNIGKYRRTSVMTGFLVSVTNLLINIGTLDNQIYMSEMIAARDIFCKLFRELVFALPGIEILQRITCLLKVYSRYSDFVQYLFVKNNRSPLQSNFKGLLCYTEDICPFCVLGMLLQNTLFKAPTLPLETCYNMISFFYNTFKTSQWIHHNNSDNICSCLSQLYKLEIESAFKILESYMEDFNNEKKNYDEWRILLEHEIIQKVLNLVNFNNYELTEKYVMVYSQFKGCEELLKQEQFNITQLNTSEDLLTISHTKFNIDF